MEAARRFKIDPAKVIHETVEGEAILIQLDSGNYYSLSGAGADVWALAIASHSPDEIAAALVEAYGAPRDVVDEAVAAVLSDLEHEGLLVPDGAAQPPQPARLSSADTPFAAPRLCKYEDMQDYLLVDPIHHVDDSGWPNARTE
jgi:hypothetical protein